MTGSVEKTIDNAVLLQINESSVSIVLNGSVLISCKQPDKQFVHGSNETQIGSYRLTVTLDLVMFSMSPKHTFIRPNVTGTYKTVARQPEPNGLSFVLLFLVIVSLMIVGTHQLNKQVTIIPRGRSGIDDVYKSTRYMTIGTTLSLYHKLERGEQICSRNEKHCFRISNTEPGCFIELISNGKRIDFVYRLMLCYLQLQSDGNLVAYNKYTPRDPLWSSGTEQVDNIDHLTVTNNGKVFFMDSDNDPIRELEIK